MKLAPAVLACALLATPALLSGCDSQDAASAAAVEPPPLLPVVTQALESHAAEYAALVDPNDAIQVDPGLLRRARELSRLAAESNETFRDAAMSDLAQLDEDARATADALAAVILDESVPGVHQQMALEALSTVEYDAAGAHLVGLM
ncbi:MAG: hypothetical protein ACYS26_10595, partial [Planctomycetota bacterium]